jgi:hypothetical protein
MICKNRKSKRLQDGAVISQPVVFVSNAAQNSFIPSTNRSAVFNSRDQNNSSIQLGYRSYNNNGQVFQQPLQPQIYPGVQQQQQIFPPHQYIQQNQQVQPNTMQNQQLYAATTHRVMTPSAPVFS